jgi:hypothetical protein
MTKFEQNVSFNQSLKELMRLKSEEYSYAYTSGYLEVLVTSMFRSLPAAERQIIMRDIQKSLESVTA